jgi:superoxide dismutase, Cu-Zn family
LKLWAALLVALIASTGCSNRPSATAELRDANGRVVGSARLQELRTGVVVRLNVEGLPPGLHGAHVHERGACVPPDFLSAGDHFDHSGMGHDRDDPRGHHAGDLPNLEVGEDGRGSMDALIPAVNLTGEASHSLFRDGGTSLVIHEHADDMKSEPGGHAGARIACGVIQR